MTANGIVSNRTLLTDKLAQAFQLLNHQTNSRPQKAHAENAESRKEKASTTPTAF